MWCRKDKWTEKRAAGKVKSTALEPPTYESLARLCGVSFGEDGSLRLTPKQIEPFIDRYRTHCYIVNANGAMTFCRIHPNKSDDISILRLVQHHEHVRMLEFSETKQKAIQTFDAAFKQLPQVSVPQRGVGKLMCWDFDEADRL